MASTDATASWPVLSETKNGGCVFQGDITTSGFPKDMHDLWRENRFCDITFVVDGEEVQGHRLVLAARSLYFDAMFKTSMREGSQSAINLPHIQPEYFKLLLGFMYLGRIELTDDNVEGILATANFFGLETVCEACGSFLVQKLTPEGCFHVLTVAGIHGQARLEAAVQEYMAKNFGLIAEHSGFQEMSFEQLESVLQNEWDLSLQNKDGSCPIPCDMENALADLLLKYITHDLDGRRLFLPRALSHVRIGLLKQKQLEELREKVHDICGPDVVGDVLVNFPRDVLPRNSCDWKIHDGRFYGKTRWEKKLSDHTFQRDCNAMVCGMDFSIVRWFSMVEEHPTYVVAGLKIYFTDGHVDVIGNQEGRRHKSFRLENGEWIIAASVTSETFIDLVMFRTNRGRELHFGGNDGGQSYPEEQYIQPPDSFGYLAGINCTLYAIGQDMTEQEMISNLSFKWRVCAQGPLLVPIWPQAGERRNMDDFCEWPDDTNSGSSSSSEYVPSWA